MGRKIDPNAEEYKKQEGAPKCGPGEKLLVCVGFERYEASTGSPCLSLRLICLQDRAGRGDEKHEVFENFTLTDAAMWRFVKFVQAIGYSEPFDVDDDNDVEKIVTNGYVSAIIEMETWKDKQQPKVKFWNPPGSYTDDPDWASWIEEAEQRHAEYLDWRASNPRKPGGGESGGNRGASGKTSTKGPDDDLPF